MERAGRMATGVAWGVALALLVGPAGPAGAYEAVEVKNGGSLAGVVRFVGDPPKLAPIPVTKDREVCGQAKPAEALVLGPSKGVKHAVVWLEGITKGKRAVAGETLLDNVKCLFQPHVMVVTPGSTARIKNSDTILHNTHGFLDQATVFNLALPMQNQMIDVSKRLKKTGEVAVQCDAHPHMRASMIVLDHPYVALTDESGAFRLTDVPPGTYKAVMWHESWKVLGTDRDGRPRYDKPLTITKEVTIPAGGEAKLDFELR